jgi:hypothetical protein
MRTIPGVILGLALLLLTLAPVALAAEGPGSEGEATEDDETDEFEDAPRALEIDEEEDAFEIRSFGTEGDRIRVRFEAEDGELRLDFVVPGSTDTELQLEIAFEAVMEFLDEDGDGRFDVGERVVQRAEVKDLPFEAPILEGLDDGHRIEVTYNASFTFRLVFFVFPTETRVNGTLVKPTEVKFDIAIDNFPFAEEDTYLAVAMKLKTEVEPAFGTSPSMEELVAIAEEYESFFRWSSSADVDGRSSPVNSTVVKVETELETGNATEFEVERTIILAYPQGEQVLHDPLVGVAISQALGSILSLIDPLVFGVMVAAAVLFVLATILVRRRQTS